MRRRWRICIGHARFAADELARLRDDPQTDLGAVWMARANASGILPRPDLSDDLIRFVLDRMFRLVAGDPRLLAVLGPALLEYRALNERRRAGRKPSCPLQFAPAPAAPAAPVPPFKRR